MGRQPARPWAGRRNPADPAARPGGVLPPFRTAADGAPERAMGGKSYNKNLPNPKFYMILCGTIRGKNDFSSQRGL